MIQVNLLQTGNVVDLHRLQMAMNLMSDRIGIFNQSTWDDLEDVVDLLDVYMQTYEYLMYGSRPDLVGRQRAWPWNWYDIKPGLVMTDECRRSSLDLLHLSDLVMMFIQSTDKRRRTCQSIWSIDLGTYR